MARTTSKGLHVWDQEDDQFNHNELAENWDKIDALLDTLDSEVTPGPKRIQTLAALPTDNLFPGRLVMLSNASGGFPGWTICRYDGSAWRPVGPPEILPAIPTLGNFAGRMVILSANSGGFSAWDLVRFDGAQWAGVGTIGLNAYSSGGGALNISGVSTTGDIYFSNSARGPVLIDRTTGQKVRLFFDKGGLHFEVVT
jgi:hypothetical protein